MIEANSTETLIEKISDFSNLITAHHECSRGKRKSTGYQKSLFAIGEELTEIQRFILTGTYKWQSYREFTICDPKRRLIMAAPFMNRVVHHAIHRLIEPILDEHIPQTVFREFDSCS